MQNPASECRFLTGQRMGHEMALLVVDDNEDDRIFLEHVLTRSGLRIAIEFVRDGAEALEYLTRRAISGLRLPDVVLLDFHLRKFNGVELARRIKAHLELASIKIVIWSGAMIFEAWEAAYEQGASLLLWKHANLSLLEKDVNTLYAMGGEGDFVEGGLGI